jgi:hypothetical protein
MIEIPIEKPEVYLQVKDLASSFVKEYVEPSVEMLDKNGTFPHDIYKKMGELGLFGITVPEEFGVN